MTFITSMMIDNVHFTVIIYPQLANYNVMYCRRYFSPRIMITSLRKPAVGDAWNKTLRDYQIFNLMEKGSNSLFKLKLILWLPKILKSSNECVGKMDKLTTLCQTCKMYGPCFLYLWYTIALVLLYVT